MPKSIFEKIFLKNENKFGTYLIFSYLCHGVTLKVRKS